MADYIDREILCQAYVHIETEFDSDQLANLKKHLELFVSTRGQFFLYETVDTDVEFKEGSLKIYLSVLGSLYIAIAQYGSFRDGVNFLADDAKRLADCVVSESLFLTKSRHTETLRTEARIGVAGSLKSAIDRLDLIQKEMGEVPLPTSTKQLMEVKENIKKLMANLNDPADPPYVAGELCKVIRALISENPTRGPKSPNPSDRQVAAYQRARLELIDETKSAGNPPKPKST